MMNARKDARTNAGRLGLLAITMLFICSTGWLVLAGELHAADSSGTAIWRTSGSALPKYNNWNGSAFTGTSTTTSVGEWRIIAGAEAPTRDEKILLGVDAGPDIAGLMWDGSAWAPLSLNPLATVSESFWWGFDVAYERRSGDALIVWNNGSTGSYGLSYAVWNGIVWTVPDSINTPVPGEPKHMHLAADPTSDELVLVVSNATSQDYALVWDGSAWGNGVTLDANGAGDDRTDIFVAYEQQSGRALVAYGHNSDSAYYRVWDGAVWTGELSIARPATASGNVRWTVLGSEPGSNRIALGVLTNNQDIWLNVWDGSAWGPSFTATNSATGTTFPGVGVAFENVTGRAVAVYGEGASAQYRTWTSGTGWSSGNTAANIGSGPNSLTLSATPGTDQIMLSVQDDNQDLKFVRWNGAAWGLPDELETSTGDNKNQPFLFLYDVRSVDLAVGMGVSTGAPAEGDTIVYTVTVSNNGDDTVTSLQLTDTLPTGLTHLFDSTTHGAYTLATGLWDIGTLADSGSAMLVIRATVDPGTSGTKILNRAFVSQRDQTDINPRNDTAEVSLGVKVAPFRVAEGSYVGDGALSRAFTNLDFSPALVIVKGDINKYAMLKTATISSSGAKELGENKEFRTDAILSLDDSGFTVGGGDNVNAIGVSYYWLAMQASPGQMAIGSYPGNGFDDVSIGEVGFQPDYVMLTSSTGEHSIQRFSGQAFDDCFEFKNSDLKHDRIQAFEPDGFQIGHDNAVNKAGVTYHYAAFKNVPNRIRTGNYVGTGIDFDSVTTVGLAPEFVLLKREGGSSTLLRPGSLAGDNTLPVMNDVAKSDAIQALLSNGFELGQDDVVNKAGDTYYWVAFKDNLPPVLNAIGPRSVNEGQNLNFGVSATDPDGDSIILIAEDVPTNATFTDNFDGTGTFNFDPDFTQAGSYNVRFIASDGAQADSETVTVTVDLGPLAYIRIERQDRTPFGDTTLTTDQDSTFFYCRGYTAGDSLLGDVEVNWTVIGVDSIGTVLPGPDSQTMLTLTDLGSGRVVATDTAGHADTSGLISSDAGMPARVQVSPDSVTLSADSSLQFTVVSLDADGHVSDPQALVHWMALGGVGIVDLDDGRFDATTVGVGSVIATTGVVPDTGAWAGSVARAPTDLADTAVVTVNPGRLSRIIVTPDSVAVSVGDTVDFVATGYDADGNVTSAGNISWRLLGAVGLIDSTGRLVTTRPGEALVSATSDIGAIADTTGTIQVDDLYLSLISLGTSAVRPQSDWTVALAFHIENYFAGPKSLRGFVVRDASRGAGSAAELLGNVDSVAIVHDQDGDSLFTAGDAVLAVAPFTTDSVWLDIGEIALSPVNPRTFFVAVKSALHPRDGDSVDVYLVPATDITTADSTVVVGPAVANSFGYLIVDGMVAAQMAALPTGTTTIQPGDSLYHVLTLQVPRNGYEADLLTALSVENLGTATETDFDSLVLYSDEGNGTWGGAAEETRLGQLIFTGGVWSLTGISGALPDSLNTLFVAASVSAFPTNGATLSLQVPVGGVQVASANDGPLDVAVVTPDNISIQTTEELTVEILPMPARTLVPGQHSRPVFGVRLTNSYAGAVALDSLTVMSLAFDPGFASQVDLDSQFDSLQLYLNRDGQLDELGLADTLLGSATLTSGVAVFQSPGLAVAAAGGQLELFVVAWLSADRAKNGNVVNFALSDSLAIHTSPAVEVAGSFPLANGEVFLIDAFPAASMAVSPVASRTFFGSQSDQLAFAFSLPPNGYASDSLRTLRLINEARLDGEGAVLSVDLWCDATGDGLSADDTLLGSFTYSAPFWQISDLHVPVEPYGLSLLVTVSIADAQFEGGTLQFGVPAGGVEYRSGTIGPDDMAVANPETHLVLPSNRLTTVSIPATTTDVLPGTDDCLLFTFALYNGYVGQVKTLKSLRLTNISRTQSTPAMADFELGQVSLYLDLNNDRALGGDSLLATGLFSAGALQLSGLGVALPPESLSYFFVVVDMPLQVIDADSLAVSIASPSDLVFADIVIINGDLPLTNGGYLVVDGSVTSQYRLLPLTPRTLSPGDTSVTLLAFQAAINGDQPDVLQGLTIENAGDADTTDLGNLELWLDRNADMVWQETDTLLSTMGYIGNAWSVGALNLPVGTSPPTLFVQADVALLATPDAAFQGVLPEFACQYASGNDGPHDQPLPSTHTFTISNSGLRIAQIPLSSSYSVGQTVVVRSTVTNVLAAAMDSVIGRIVYSDHPSSVMLDSAQAGPVSLLPGQSTDFAWYFTAAQAGDQFWRLRAEAPGVPDSSAVIRTNTVIIQTAPAAVSVRLINSIPTAVTRGQANVFPLSVAYAHPDVDPTSASVRLDSLRVRVEDGAGNSMPADQVISRLVLSSGSEVVASQSTIPAQSSVWLVFTAPSTVAPGESRNYSLLVDIDSLAVASSFALALEAPGSVPLVDANTLSPVALDPGLSFPMRTASCRIDDASQQMAVSYRNLLAATTNYGQQNVPIVRLYLRHPGLAGNSQIQLSSLSVAFIDLLSAPLQLSQLFDEVALISQQNVIGSANGGDLDFSLVEIALNLPVTLSPGQIDSLDIVASVDSLTLQSGFSLSISDSTLFRIRDLSSGSPLNAGTDTLLSAGLTFPIVSGWTDFLAPAGSPQICLVDALPTSIPGGVDTLSLVNLTLSLPGDASQSPVRVGSLRVSVRDSSGAAIAPNDLFDRIGFSVAGGPAEYQPFVDVVAGAAVFRFTDTSLVLQPGASLDLTLVADIEADVPVDNFHLVVADATALSVRDATDTTRVPDLQLAAGCSSSFPFATGTSHVFLPAGRPILTPDELPVQMAHPGQMGMPLLAHALAYTNVTAQADIELQALCGEVLRRTGSGLVPAPAASIFAAVHLLLDDVSLATDSLLAADSVILTLPAGYRVSTGQTVRMNVRADLRADAALGNYLIRFADSTFVELADFNSAAPVYAFLAGGDYPVWSAEVSVAACNLSESFSNYPNPFHPGRGELTTIRYDLAQDAQVDIEIYSITGRSVKRITESEFRAAGTHQDAVWSGQNDSGSDVTPGTYFCVITARYSTGETQTARRKIAVVR